jgi:hypothetical protein
VDRKSNAACEDKVIAISVFEELVNVLEAGMRNHFVAEKKVRLFCKVKLVTLRVLVSTGSEYLILNTPAFASRLKFATAAVQATPCKKVETKPCFWRSVNSDSK